MLKISKLTDYATAVMRYLAEQPSSQTHSARDIAEVLNITVPAVSKVLKKLAEVSLVSAERGATGGYRLARPADKISVAEIVGAIEGRTALTECSIDEHSCEQASHCSIKDNWRFINNAIIITLEKITLADMCCDLSKQPNLFQGIPIITTAGEHA